MALGSCSHLDKIIFMGFLATWSFLFPVKKTVQKLGSWGLYLIARGSVHEEAQDAEDHTVHTHRASALARGFQCPLVQIHTRAFMSLSW